MVTIALFIGFLIQAAVLLCLMALGAGMAFWSMVICIAVRFEQLLVTLTLCGIALFLFSGSRLAALIMPAVLA